VRKLILLAGLVFAAARLLGRRHPSAARAVIGYADGSTVDLPTGSPLYAELVAIAGEMLRSRSVRA
jgi:hypothetical protein